MKLDHILIILAIASFISLFAWALSTTAKKAVADWKAIEDLERRCNVVTNKEEIDQLYEELRLMASKNTNKFTLPHLLRIDGYLRGLYNQFKELK